MLVPPPPRHHDVGDHFLKIHHLLGGAQSSAPLKQLCNECRLFQFLARIFAYGAVLI